MLNRTYNIINPAEEVLNYLRANKSGCQDLRRRAIIYKYNEQWMLRSCVVEGLSKRRGEVSKEPSRVYSNAVLFEDWLTLEKLQEFIEKTLQGSILIGDYLLEATTVNRSWSKERLPLSNAYMPYAGYVWTSRFHDQIYGMHDVLLVPKQPYYPDIDEAVKDWIPFTSSSPSDGRRGEINLLLPETRAYFEDAIPKGDSLDLQISGVEANNLTLEVKGAWWDEKGIHHFSEQVSDGHSQLNIPGLATRFDYILVDSEGTVYDYQQENGKHHTGLGRNRNPDNTRNLSSSVREACKNGEGPSIEFKPFIYPENSKLKELFKAVVAFANTQGGQIYIGINDEGELEGVDAGLEKWAKAKPDEAACDKYINTIRTKIRDELRSHVQLDLEPVVVDGKRIVIVEVAASKEKPVTFKQEQTTLYVRRGSSNIRATPEEWQGVIGSSGNVLGLNFPG